MTLLIIAHLIISIFSFYYIFSTYCEEIKEHKATFNILIFSVITIFCFVPILNLFVLYGVLQEILKEMNPIEKINDEITNWIRGEKDNE